MQYLKKGNNNHNSKIIHVNMRFLETNKLVVE